MYKAFLHFTKHLTETHYFSTIYEFIEFLEEHYLRHVHLEFSEYTIETVTKVLNEELEKRAQIKDSIDLPPFEKNMPWYDPTKRQIQPFRHELIKVSIEPTRDFIDIFDEQFDESYTGGTRKYLTDDDYGSDEGGPSYDDSP